MVDKAAMEGDKVVIGGSPNPPTKENPGVGGSWGVEISVVDSYEFCST